MANEQQVALLKQGVTAWNEWRRQNPTVTIDLRGADLRGVSFPAGNLQNGHLEGANLSQAGLHRADLSHAHLEGATLTFANLQGATLNAAHLERADLTGAHLETAILDLEKASLARANLTNSVLSAAHLAGADLWAIEYGSEHRSLDDGSETIDCGLRNGLHWGLLRSIGKLPLFGVSYVSLIFSVVVVNGTGFLNRYLPAWLEWGSDLMRRADLVRPGFEPPRLPLVPTPERMRDILLASVFLVIGTTFYKLVCPSRVQTFSETEWVEAHGRARLQYFAKSWSRKWAQWPTLIFTTGGGVWGLWIVLEQLFGALRHLVE